MATREYTDKTEMQMAVIHDTVPPLLDMSADRWNLREGEASIVEGVDVVAPRTFQPDRGRRPIGVSIDSDDQPIVDAIGSDIEGITAVNIRGRLRNPIAQAVDTGGGAYVAATGRITDATGLAPGAYTIQPGDKVTIYTPNSLLGVYTPVSTDGANYIEISPRPSHDVASGVGAIVERALDGGYFGVQTNDIPAANGNIFERIVKSDFEYRQSGPWPSEIVGAQVFFNSDEHIADVKQCTVLAISTFRLLNDAIEVSPVFTSHLGVLASGDGLDKFEIAFGKVYSKSGMWVTNGKKFWLLQDGKYVQYLDLGDDDFLGYRWSGAQIASNMLMFVNDRLAPRIVRLDLQSSKDIADDLTLAGCIAPMHPRDVANELPKNLEMRWLLGPGSSTGGALENGTYKAKVRAVNLFDSAASEFVQCQFNSTSPAAGTGVDSITLSGGTSTQSFPVHPVSGATTLPFQPNFPFSRRWTHIEIWRTTADTEDYFLERRVPVVRFPDCERFDGLGASNNSWDILVATPSEGTNKRVCSLSDTALVALPLALGSDIVGGGVPPICRKVASLAGITICAGHADRENLTYPVLDELSLSADNYSANFGGAKVVISDPNGILARIPDFTVNTEGYRVEVWDSSDVVRLEPAIYDVASCASGLLTLTKAADGGSSLSNIRGCIRRQMTLSKWPVIESDEDIWYSRTDLFSPENFPKRTKKLSSVGDTLRNMVKVGRYIACIMDRGVHLLYFDGSDIQVDTLAQYGHGSPWEHSIVTFGNVAMWAAADGPRQMDVSNDPNEEGHRGTIQSIGDQRTNQFFIDASRNGYDVDAGFDVRNSCVRWRVKITSNSYQTLVYSIENKRWSIIHDDNGIAYVSSRSVETDAPADARLYSVTAEGAVFEAYHDGVTHPYDGLTVQAKLSEVTSFVNTRITYQGKFSSDMTGDVLRILSDNKNRNGLSRVIRAATNDYIEFDTIMDLSADDTFIIGATRFKVRFAPYLGTSPESVKTIEGAQLNFQVGDRNKNNPDWPNPPAGKVTVRTYRDYGNVATSEKQQEMAIFADDATGYDIQDRSSSVEGQGRAVEVEIESVEARTDFKIEMIRSVVREEGDSVGSAT